ncbi:cytochrome C [Peredibacter sp. HCB2-198]|uniref:cytochrome C n=1 Tax=Peredibacter sp. HCB2-198 TaxID=3383025 RepID=UPI0038B48B41
MIKAAINYLSDPLYSFTAFIILFAVAMKRIDIVGTKKFGLALLIGVLAIFGWMVTDPVFFSVISLPDNIPIIILNGLVFWSTWYALYRGHQNDLRIEKGEQPIEGTPENREKVWAWPNLVYTELFCGILCTIFLIVWAIFFKAPLEEPANPTWAPNPAKAPWYFLGLQEMLVYFDPWMAGVVLPGFIIVGLIAIPFIDINPKGNGYYTFKERKFAIAGFLFGWLALWVYLIQVGTFLRGPNWTFYGPFEYWDFHKVVAENNVNLSEYFWIKLLNMGLPKNIFLREIVGILFMGVYCVASVPFITKKWGYKYLPRMGAIRYYLMVFLLLGMALLPLKMYLRWFFTLKYIVAMPEFELNL